MYEIMITFIFTIFAITEIIIQISCRNAFSILSLMVFQAFKFRSQRIVWSAFELIMITCWNVNHYLQTASLLSASSKHSYIYLSYTAVTWIITCSPTVFRKPMTEFWIRFAIIMIVYALPIGSTISTTYKNVSEF